MKDEYSGITEFVSDIDPPTERIFVCGPSFTNSSGIAHSMKNQARTLSNNGHDVEILCFKSDMEKPDDVGVSQFGLAMNPPYSEIDKLISVFSIRGLRIMNKMRRADIIIAHRFPFTIFAWICSKIFDSKYILWSWPSGPSMEKFSGLTKIWAATQHYLETEHVSVSDATHICSISGDSKEYISQKTNKDCILVPYAIDQDRLSNHYSEAEINQELGIDESTIVVLYVGRITPRKNVSELVSILENISDRDLNIELFIIGGETMEGFSNSLKRKSSANVNFMGYIDNGSLLGAIYERADVYATCSRSEGWSIPVAEAKYFDTPVVAFDSVPAVQELEEVYDVPDGDYEKFKENLGNAISYFRNKRKK